MLRKLNGPQTMGNGRAFWAGFIATLAIALLYPAVSDPYDVGNVAYLLIFTLTALGLSLMWGYTGMFSFGQTAFFGVAGYGLIAMRERAEQVGGQFSLESVRGAGTLVQVVLP